MTALTRQVRSEWRKLRTLRSTWAVLGLGLATELVLRTVSAAIVSTAADPADVAFALRPSIVFGVVVALLPLLLAACEWRWQTAVSTFTLQPRRERVFVAKAIVAAVAGLAVAALLTISSLAVAVPLLQERAIALPGDSVLVALVFGPIAAGPTLAVVGVSLGTIIRDQVAALAVAVILLFAAPLPLILLGPEWYAWSPSAWVDALAGQRVVNRDLLPPQAAGALIVGFALGSSAVASQLLNRRDVA